MGFLQTTFLFSLAALAIPLLLHLFSRWQTQKIELGTIRFLQEVLTENVHRRRIRRWLLLATRMLLLGVLAMLFARPFLFEATKRDGDRRRVILIDRSASMSMRGTQGKAIDVAIEKAMAAAKELGADAKIDWAWFDSKVHPFQPRNGRTILSNAKNGSTGGHTDYAAAIAWARDRLAEDNRAKSDVVMITDLQRQGIGDPTDIHFPPDVPFQIIDVGREAASNLAVTRIDLAIGSSKSAQKNPALETGSNRSSYNPTVQGLVRPDQTIYVHTTLFNYGPMQREDVPLIVTARQGTKTAKVRTTINAMPEQATESQIELGKLGVGEWEISVEADLDDDLGVDNRRVHGVAIDSAPSILLVGEPNPEGGWASSRFFVHKALREGLARDQPRFIVQTASNGEAIKALSNPSKWRAVVLADATNVDGSLIASMERYVGQGGHVLAFTGQMGGELGAAKWNNSPLAPGRFERVRNAGVVPFRLTSNEPGHSILKPFDDPQTGDLHRLTFRKAISVRLSERSKALASFDSDLPGIVEMQYEKGRLVWFLSDAGDGWSNWTSNPLYLPLVHQMVCDLAGLTGEGPIRFRNVGDAKTFRAASAIADSNDESLSQASLSKEKQAETAFEDTGFVRGDNALFVVNTLESESDTARMSAGELRKAFELLEPEAAADVKVNIEVKSIKKQELWPWLAAMMVLLLVFEFGLSNRTPP
jgi:hypothetical protein